MELGCESALLPAIVERKGSLYLRSDHMKYGRTTLNSNWHADREAEPKDYDICNPNGKQNLLKATYNRIGNLPDSEISLETTTHSAMNQREELKEVYQEQPTHRPLVTRANFTSTASSAIQTGETTVLPRHTTGHNKQHLETTHKMDYRWESPVVTSTDGVEEGPPSSETHAQNRRRLSEFTDTDNFRREGIRVWQD